MEQENEGFFINLNGIPLDLNSGMIEAVTNPPSGFVSKHRFAETDLSARLRAINWFARCGEPVIIDLTVPILRVSGWAEAIESCTSPRWEDIELEAQNQLTLWLHLHDRGRYQHWNVIVAQQKQNVLDHIVKGVIVPVVEKIVPVPDVIVPSVEWDLLSALMENSYLSSGHASFFFLELLMVYEAGHFPCGWLGDWPRGELLVY